MDKYNELVELTKIINESPFKTLWIYWETDMYYDITNSLVDDRIVVRSHDKRISGNEAWIRSKTEADIPIPIGTYSIGEYIPQGIGDMIIGSSFIVGGETIEYYNFIVTTTGYIDHVTVGTNSILVNVNDENNIPNVKEEYIEWETIDKNIKPLYKENSYKSYTFGASYSLLTRRITDSPIIETFYITTDDGVILTDDDENNLIF